MQRSGPRSASEQENVADDDSVVGEVNKAEALALVDELTLPYLRCSVEID